MTIAIASALAHRLLALIGLLHPTPFVPIFSSCQH
jgi:hypothetical protein